MDNASKSSEVPNRKSPHALRDLPSIDELLATSALIDLSAKHGRPIVLRAARKVLAAIRAESSRKSTGFQVPDTQGIEDAVAEEVNASLSPSLRRVINATGVVLHTNLGRAPLSKDAIEAIAATAVGYSNLEYDVTIGKRGKRDSHTSEILAELAGAEAAIVVNNNAAAVFLVLHALAKNKEVIVSRGELIEIGDGFRIPDIMAESGAVVREVGTTNRTHLRDYESAIGEETRLLLRVHPSNFHITGFASRPGLDELVEVGERYKIPVYEDLGSGCLADLSTQGITEPLVRASCEAGVSVVTFSCDKLLGGPQAGIIAGKKSIVETIRRNPLFRALRVDKLTIAALEATAKAYLREAYDEIPSLRMIRLTAAELLARAERFCAELKERAPEASAEVIEGFSVIGGGSTPDQQIASPLIAIVSSRHSARALDERLRNSKEHLPVIARIEDDRLILDLRTASAEEEAELLSALLAAVRE